jgi:hypothetical protein
LKHNKIYYDLNLQNLIKYPLFLIDETGVSTQVGVSTQAGVSTPALQEFYYLSYTASPFCFGYFGDGVSQTIFPGWPGNLILLIFQVA